MSASTRASSSALALRAPRPAGPFHSAVPPGWISLGCQTSPVSSARRTGSSACSPVSCSQSVSKCSRRNSLPDVDGLAFAPRGAHRLRAAARDLGRLRVVPDRPAERVALARVLGARRLHEDALAAVPARDAREAAAPERRRIVELERALDERRVGDEPQRQVARPDGDDPELVGLRELGHERERIRPELQQVDELLPRGLAATGAPGAVVWVSVISLGGRARRIVRTLRELLLERRHHREHDVLAPVAGGDLDADGQAGAADLRLARRAIDPIHGSAAGPSPRRRARAWPRPSPPASRAR